MKIKLNLWWNVVHTSPSLLPIPPLLKTLHFIKYVCSPINCWRNEFEWISTSSDIGCPAAQNYKSLCLLNYAGCCYSWISWINYNPNQVQVKCPPVSNLHLFPSSADINHLWYWLLNEQQSYNPNQLMIAGQMNN